MAADQRKGQPGSKEAKGQAALEALRREEAALNQQAADLASQVGGGAATGQGVATGPGSWQVDAGSASPHALHRCCAAAVQEAAGSVAATGGSLCASTIGRLHIRLLALLHQPSLAVLQIRALEHQLSALRAQASDVEDRRTSLAQRKAAASKAAGAAGGAKAAAGVLGSGHYQVRMGHLQS